MSRSPDGFAVLPRLVPLLVLGACAVRSEIVELSPGVFALGTTGSNPAVAARAGVEDARAHCAASRREFEVIRTAIGPSDYQIAFRCLTPGWLEANSPALPPSGGM